MEKTRLCVALGSGLVGFPPSAKPCLVKSYLLHILNIMNSRKAFLHDNKY